jgi:hypothetical protein
VARPSHPSAVQLGMTAKHTETHMEVEIQSQVAFHLTGRRPGADLEAVDPLALRPALLARYRDLTTLRYDFPLVLVDDAPGDAYVQSLSGLIDGILGEIAREDDGERLTQHLLRLERQIRTLMTAGTTGSLATVWDAAAERLGTRADPLLRDSLNRARAALKVDGELLGCDAALPVRLVKHAWNGVQQRKARRFSDDIRRLIQKLADILAADFARSETGRSAESLRASVGAAHAEIFDFSAMSRVLGKGSRDTALPPVRRERIRSLLAVLESQQFYPVAGHSGPAIQRYAFVFDSCAAALAAYRERFPKVVALAKAMAMAELEIAGEFREAQHEALFDGYGEDGLDAKELALFPDYLVCISARKLSAIESSTLMDVLSAGLPIKVLLQSDDLLAAPAKGDSGLGFGVRNQQLADMAIGLNTVYVMQASGSNLFQCRDRLRAGLVYPGPALLNVFSGACALAGDLPPYLVAAAALESRAFPSFSYDPSAGPDWASRFDLQANSQPERDWPVHSFAYEDEAHQSVKKDVAFTLADFVACDRRYARHLALVPRSKWSENLISVDESLARDGSDTGDRVPCLLMVDRDNTLHKVIVDDKLMREVRRCREHWHSLQELGGIHNSHAARLLARESKAREEREAVAAAPQPTRDPMVAAPTPGLAPAAAEAPPEKSPDEAYIETARCTSCNECTNVNDKMFAYNENKQAYIANLEAGTYAQLVEAAESCQVSIIHPGKPRNPNEPDLEDLLRRADAFK